MFQSPLVSAFALIAYSSSVVLVSFAEPLGKETNTLRSWLDQRSDLKTDGCSDEAILSKIEALKIGYISAHFRHESNKKLVLDLDAKNTDAKVTAYTASGFALLAGVAAALPAGVYGVTAGVHAALPFAVGGPTFASATIFNTVGLTPMITSLSAVPVALYLTRDEGKIDRDFLPAQIHERSDTSEQASNVIQAIDHLLKILRVTRSEIAQAHQEQIKKLEKEDRWYTFGWDDQRYVGALLSKAKADLKADAFELRIVPTLIKEAVEQCRLFSLSR